MGTVSFDSACEGSTGGRSSSLRQSRSAHPCVPQRRPGIFAGLCRWRTFALPCVPGTAFALFLVFIVMLIFALKRRRGPLLIVSDACGVAATSSQNNVVLHQYLIMLGGGRWCADYQLANRTLPPRNKSKINNLGRS